VGGFADEGLAIWGKTYIGMTWAAVGLTLVAHFALAVEWNIEKWSIIHPSPSIKYKRPEVKWISYTGGWPAFVGNLGNFVPPP
jgi:hypothetical protein